MVVNCKIQTPAEYVIKMLDYIGYKHNLYGEKVLENSCGEGNILVEIVRRYIQDANLNERTDKEIIEGLQNDICA